MPGIFGVVDASRIHADRPQQDLVDIVRRMSSAMMYEASHSAVLASFPSLGACVGRVGLSDSKYYNCTVEPRVLVMTAGETISEPDGSNASDMNDRLGPGANRLLRSYQRFGEDGLTKVSGTIAAFVGDSTHAKCILFADRYGKERIFLHFSGTRAFFASEAKALLAVVPETRAFDPRGLAELLACGCTLGTHSLFREIEVLEGGTVLTFQGRNIGRRRYFDSSQLEQIEQASANEFLEGFPESLRCAVNSSANSSPDVGISLTGGLDSRMIMACLDAPSRTLPCYTFGSMYRTTGDVAVGRQVAASCGQPHDVIELGNAFLAGLPETLEQSVYASDGYLGLSGAAELYVNRLARSIAPARMTGNWGGELLRGVRAFKYAIPRDSFIRPDLVKLMTESAAVFSPTCSNPISAALFHQMPLQGYGRHAIERSQLVMRSPFLADDVVTWLYRAPAAVRESKEVAAAVIGRRPHLLAIPTDLGLLGSKRSFVRRLRRRALVKAEYLTSHGAPDWLVRVSSRLPASFVETRLLGVDKFQHFRFWIRRALAGFVRDTLIHNTSAGLDSWFDMNRVEQMVDDHIDGRANHTDGIDKLLTIASVEKALFSRFSGYSTQMQSITGQPSTSPEISIVGN